MLFVQCFPRAMASVVAVLAILALGFLGILILMGKVTGISTVVTLIVGLVLVGIAVLFAAFLCFYRLRNKLVPIFLDWGTCFLREHCGYFLLIFIFIILKSL